MDPMRPLLMLLLGAALASAQDDLAVPAFRVDLLPGGRANVVVDQKTHPMDLAKANALKAKVDALDPARMRSDLAKLRTVEREALAAEKEGETRDKAVEREAGRVKDAERQVAALQKRQDQLEDQVRRAQRAKAGNLDDLRRQLNSVNLSLAQERKDLTRSKENLVRAQKNRKETAAAAEAASGQAAALRKSLAARTAQLRALLDKELGA
jgi:chromosome segregation ATPase